MYATKKNKGNVPYCFKSQEAAQEAERTLNRDHPGMNAYSTGLNLYIPETYVLQVDQIILETLGGHRYYS